jgi:excinuclease UvrABC nuclease subunit
MDRTHSVYIAKDEDHRVLYVGSTGRGIARFHEHAGSSRWWPLMSEMEWRHRDSRREALALERRLITQLQPIYNERRPPT